MYNSYTGPRAFLPHSAINLSVKTPAEVGSSSTAAAVQSSLDLSVSDGGHSPYLLNAAGTGGGPVPTGYNSVSGIASNPNNSLKTHVYSMKSSDSP